MQRLPYPPVCSPLKLSLISLAALHNPYNSNHTAQGEGGALVACGGSKIEIGTDIGGSIRIPAHFCGIWSLQASAGQFPMWGSGSSMMGLEGLPIVTSPMAGSLEDLHEFLKRVILGKPWQYDHTVRSFFSLLVSLLKTPTSVFLYLGKLSIFETRVVN